MVWSLVGNHFSATEIQAEPLNHLHPQQQRKFSLLMSYTYFWSGVQKLFFLPFGAKKEKSMSHKTHKIISKSEIALLVCIRLSFKCQIVNIFTILEVIYDTISACSNDFLCSLFNQKSQSCVFIGFTHNQETPYCDT